MTLRPGEQPFSSNLLKGNQPEKFFFCGRHVCFGVYLEGTRDLYSRGAYVTVRARDIYFVKNAVVSHLKVF